MAAPAKPKPKPRPPAKPSAADQNARGIINSFLNDIGLGALGDFAWDVYKRTGSIDLVHLEIQTRPEYKTRFAGRLALQDQGFSMTEGEQIAYENQGRDLMRAAGMPMGFYDKPGDFTNLIANGVSLSELSTRINDSFAKAAEEPQVVKDAFGSFYGAKGVNALAAMALDVHVALPVIQRHIAASEAGGYLSQQNIQVGRSLAERIADATGNNQQAIKAGAQQLGQWKAAGLFDARFNEKAATISSGVAAGFEGSGQAQHDLQHEIDTRVASTQGGENVDISHFGAAGLGSATK